MKDSIKAGELRLNNWVMYATHQYVRDGLKGVPVIVDLDVMGKILNPPMIDPIYEPIPLSKEVLDRCGFKEDNYGLWILYSEYSLSVHKPLLWIKWVNAEGGGYWDVCTGEALDRLSNVNRIQNLHELQNIAFAFGKELEITP